MRLHQLACQRPFSSRAGSDYSTSWTSASPSQLSSNTYPLSSSHASQITHVSGEPFAVYLDLSKVSVGDHFTVPYEITLTGTSSSLSLFCRSHRR